MVQQATTNQGAVTLNAKHDFDFSLDNCNFTKNERAINIDVQEGGSGSIIVRSSHFTQNKAWGPGGGIHLYQVSGHTTLNIKDTTFNSNTALGLTDKAQQMEQDFGNGTLRRVYIELSKISGSGGAIALNVKDKGTCTATIQQCKFQGNTAENYGGSIYVTSGVTTTLNNNEFYNVDGISSLIRPTIGDIIESMGNIIVMNSDFNVTSAQGDTPIFSYRADRDDAFLQTDEMSFVCPKGYEADQVLSTVKSQARPQPIETLLLYCRPCSEGTYSLEFGKIRLTKDKGVVHENSRTCKRK